MCIADLTVGRIRGCRKAASCEACVVLLPPDSTHPTLCLYDKKREVRFAEVALPTVKPRSW